MKKIAIIADSTCDIPVELAKEKGIYVLPLKVNYKDKQFSDGVDITPEEVYSNLSKEIPTTSLPTGEEIADLFDKIKADGYDDVLCVHLSSGLSGTFNFVSIMASERDDLNIKLIDTKNIAMGAGFVALLAADYVANQDKTLEEAYHFVSEKKENSKVFFAVNTLEYLIKGGRIGKVSGTIGSKLNLKPIISCNENGIYHTVSKTFGRAQSINKLIDVTDKFLKNATEFNICVSHSGVFDEASNLLELVKSKFPTAAKIYLTNISPVLGVHTGPGLLGIGVQVIK